MTENQDIFTTEQLNITEMKMLPTVSSTFANRYKPTRRPKFAKELETLPPGKNYFFKSPPSKNFKNATTQPDTKTHLDNDC